RRAGAKGADPHRYQITVTVAVADQVGVNAELFGQYLLECRTVTLVMIHTAGHQHDGTRRVEADFGMLVVAPAARRDCSCDAASVEHAASLRCALPLDRSTVPGKRKAIVEVLGEISAVIDLLHRRLVRHRSGGDRVAPPQHDRVDAK